MKFTKGVFQSFRATTKVHIGQLGRDIFKDDIVEFDGQTLNMGGETFQISTLRSAIKAGWFVASSDTTTTYVPKPAAISVRSTDDSRKPMEIQTVNDEERVVKVIKDSDQKNKTPSEPQDSQVAAKIKTSAKQRTVLTDASAVSKEINRLDSSLTKAEIHTGDVSEATTGDTLEELLPDAAIATTGVDLEWDTNRHWKTRVKKAVELHSTNPEIYNKILSVETAAVRKRIEEAVS